MRKISAIGDEVNTTSRIEAANKDFDTQLLISQSAYEEVQRSVEIHKMHRSSLKGKSGEYVLYEIKI
jgi:adenylate cyclase